MKNGPARLASADLLGAFQGILKQVGSQCASKEVPKIRFGAFQGILKQVGSQCASNGALEDSYDN
jgi:hypothetical protein